MIIQTLLLFFILQSNATSNSGQISEIRWISIEEAMHKSAQNPKPIMVDFYTDWCGWCKKLDQSTYIDSTVVHYVNENYYAVKFDAEQKEDIQFLGKTFSFVPSGSKGTHQFAMQMANRNGRIGYPTITFLDASGNRIAAEAGFKDSKKMLLILKYYGEGFFKEMDFNTFQLKLIEQSSK